MIEKHAVAGSERIHVSANIMITAEAKLLSSENQINTGLNSRNAY
jgi:hypothetical protein